MRRSNRFAWIAWIACVLASLPLLGGCGTSAALGVGGTHASSTSSTSGTSGGSSGSSAGGAISSTTSAGGASDNGGSAGMSSAAGAGGGAGVSAGSSGWTGSTSGAASSASSSSGADGGVAQSGDCATNADCPSGACVALTPGGFRVCSVPAQPATTCDATVDQCCPSSSPCPNGEACDVGPLVPACVGTPPAVRNQCALDQCAADGDCSAGQICVPAGTLGIAIRACVDAECKHDGDCAAYPGGECAPVQNPCCSATAGLFCVYPGHGGCRTNAGCGKDQYCSAGICETGSPICPA